MLLLDRYVWPAYVEGTEQIRDNVLSAASGLEFPEGTDYVGRMYDSILHWDRIVRHQWELRGGRATKALVDNPVSTRAKPDERTLRQSFGFRGFVYGRTDQKSIVDQEFVEGNASAVSERRLQRRGNPHDARRYFTKHDQQDAFRKSLVEAG